MKKLLIFVLLVIVCTVSTFTRVYSYSQPDGRIRHCFHNEYWRREDIHSRRQDEERRRAEERRRQDEERRRTEERRREERYYRDDFHYDSREKLSTRQVLRETAECLVQAQRAARSGNYRFGLGKAYAHQEQARNLYFERRYERARLHSLRAREIANYIIVQNRSGSRRYSERYRRYQENDSLDNSLSIRIVDDNIALKLRIDLD